MADRRRLLAGLAAATALAVLGWQLARSLHQPDPLDLQREHWVDEESLALVRRTGREVPPLQDAGRTLVVARCFQGDDGLVIGWLERYPPAARERLAEQLALPEPDPGTLIAASLEREVRAPAPGSPWLAARSRAGQAVMRPPARRDGSLCLPAFPQP